MIAENYLERLKQKDVVAYQELIKKYSPYVVAIIYKISSRQLKEQDIEELAADIFIKLWEKASTLEVDGTKEKAYIATMTRNMTLNKLRQLKRIEESVLEENIVVENTENPESMLLIEEEKQIVKSALDQLPEPDREIFIRRYFYRQRVKEIGVDLGLPSQTVTNKLHRGKQKLEKMLRGRGVQYE